jgi:hypothetical protein
LIPSFGGEVIDDPFELAARRTKGFFLGAMRLYFPKPEALNGTWKKKPPMTKTQ